MILRALRARPLAALTTLVAVTSVGVAAAANAPARRTGAPGASGGVSLIGAGTTGATSPASGTTGTTGGTVTGGGGLVPTATPKGKIPPPPSKHSKGAWLTDTTITEYWPAPEAWFTGKLVKVPGLTTEHRIDWLYSATGVSMQGDGIGLDGKIYHINALGNGGWVTVAGRSTSPSDGWAAGAPYWRSGAFWRNKKGGVTFPLQAGGWSAGAGKRYVSLPGVSFATGTSLPLKFWQSIAVDPSVIPLGSEVYIPAYRNDGYGGWFLAQDTGGAINGHHVDVYRSPPPDSSDGGALLTGQRIYVIKPQK